MATCVNALSAAPGLSADPRFALNPPRISKASVTLCARKKIHEKVIFDCNKLSPHLRRAIKHSHDDEVPGL
jgi:hypothetical protein